MPHAPAKPTLVDIYERLLVAYGPQHWWPAETTTEIVIGAILTQNTAWRNVERAIARLKSADCLTWEALRDCPDSELMELIRPSGTFRVKAKRLRAFVDTLWRDHGGSLDEMLTGELADVRDRLLVISGIGPETADAILLYAGRRPSFVVDSYTKRILRRHFIIGDDTDYKTVQETFHRAIPIDETIYNEYHGLLVTLGKNHCGPLANCEECPLRDLPHDERL